MDKYIKLLKFFQVRTLETNVLDTPKCVIVTMDDIHDSIIYNGISMEKPLSHYIVKAKHYALNRLRNETNRTRILEKNMDSLLGVPFDFSRLDEYDFTPKEYEVIYEKLSGIPKYKSKISRKTYDKIIEQIKNKILLSI